MPDTALMFVHCLTSLHPGSGTALGVVDLPVQRERYTQWPVIPGASLKGVMRAACARGTAEPGDDGLLATFGPAPGNAGDHAGALSISDARILAFPVRSLKGVFAWVTCAEALRRMGRDFAVLGGTGFPEIPDVPLNRAVAAPDSPLLMDGKSCLLLEEFEFERDPADGGPDAVSGWIACRATADPATAERLRSHLVILNDSDFTHFVRHATEVTARIGLDSATKTVRSGALFYEETLPPETLFYALTIAEDSRRESAPMPAGQVLGWLRRNVPAIVQVGGGETIGRGLCAVRFSGTHRGTGR